MTLFEGENDTLWEEGVDRTNPFNYAPLNWGREYIKTTTPNGCQIFFPINTASKFEREAVQRLLQQYLDSQLEEVCKSGGLPEFPTIE